MDGFVECPGLRCGAWDAHKSCAAAQRGVGDALGLLLHEGMCGVL